MQSQQQLIQSKVVNHLYSGMPTTRWAFFFIFAVRGNFTGECKLYRGGFSLFVRSLAVTSAPVFYFMELRDILIEYAAHLRNNFHPVEQAEQSTMMPTTADLVQEIEQHFGELGTEDDPVNKSELVAILKELGFKSIMLPGTLEMRWLLAEKK